MSKTPLTQASVSEGQSKQLAAVKSRIQVYEHDSQSRSSEKTWRKQWPESAILGALGYFLFNRETG